MDKEIDRILNKLVEFHVDSVVKKEMPYGCTNILAFDEAKKAIHTHYQAKVEPLRKAVHKFNELDNYRVMSWPTTIGLHAIEKTLANFVMP